MKTLFAFVKWCKVSRQDEFVTIFWTHNINKYFLYGLCKPVCDQVMHKARNLQLKNKFGRETSLNVSSLVLPESVWAWPLVHVGSQIHYWATSVTLQRCSSPAVWKCTCWWSDTVRHLQDKPLHILYKDSGKTAKGNDVIYYKFPLKWSTSWFKCFGQCKPNVRSPNENPPDVGSDGVVLRPPRCRVVDGLPVHLQPLTHLPQTLLEDGRDPAVVCRTDVHQHVSSTGHGLHQGLKHTHTHTHIGVCNH